MNTGQCGEEKRRAQGLFPSQLQSWCLNLHNTLPPFSPGMWEEEKKKKQELHRQTGQLNCPDTALLARWVTSPGGTEQGPFLCTWLLLQANITTTRPKKRTCSIAVAMSFRVTVIIYLSPVAASSHRNKWSITVCVWSVVWKKKMFQPHK